jgi:15-cis-phytoene synthase
MREPSPITQGSKLSAQNSQRFCARLTRRSRSSFRFAFRTLPWPKREAMDALYAFMRVTDDLADGDGPPDCKRAALANWRDRLTAALNGVYSHRVHAALHHAVRTFDIPAEYLFDVIAGCETDVGSVRLASFEELRTYCYRVASVVGLACVRVWGLRPGVTFAESDPPATAAGYAFQLTNVLRDLGEDLQRGRVYLPADELARFDADPETWRSQSGNFRAVMRFQCERAEGYFREAETLLPLLSRDGRRVFGLMSSAYRQLLARIVAADYDVFTKRVRLSRWAKLKLAARALIPGLA